MAKPKQKPTDTSSVDDLLLERVRGTAAKAADELDNCVTRVSSALREPGAKYNDKLASHLAYLGGHVVQILGELRKLDAGLRAQIRKLTPEQEHQACLDYVRELPLEKRSEIRALIDELDCETSVLGHDTETVQEGFEL
jgi:hypothetical protein